MNFKQSIEQIAKRSFETDEELFQYTVNQWGLIVTWLHEKLASGDEKIAVKSMNKIVDYLYADEEKDYENSGRPEQHIFNDIKVVINWIKKVENKIN